MQTVIYAAYQELKTKQILSSLRTHQRSFYLNRPTDTSRLWVDSRMLTRCTASLETVGSVDRKTFH